MRLCFLGTRGNIDGRTRRHRMHASLLVAYRRKRIMIDCGDDWLASRGGQPLGSPTAGTIVGRVDSQGKGPSRARENAKHTAASGYTHSTARHHPHTFLQGRDSASPSPGARFRLRRAGLPDPVRCGQSRYRVPLQRLPLLPPAQQGGSREAVMRRPWGGKVQNRCTMSRLCSPLASDKV